MGLSAAASSAGYTRQPKLEPTSLQMTET